MREWLPWLRVILKIEYNTVIKNHVHKDYLMSMINVFQNVVWNSKDGDSKFSRYI